jgi:hypothetical protein
LATARAAAIQDFSAVSGNIQDFMFAGLQYRGRYGT